MAEREQLSARQRADGRVASATRAYSEFWQGASLDRTKLSKALPSLPDTAGELKAVAAKLGAPASDIHLGADASETTVKHASLADYRVVYFATHGLVAGDVEGLGEPSLALTLANKPTELDDGLLTASEVVQLKLNADWVVLSACNTAAATSREPRRCRGWRGPSSMPGRGLSWSRTGRLTRTPRRSSPPRRSTS